MRYCHDIREPNNLNVEIGDLLVLLHNGGTSLVLPITKIDEHNFYVQRKDRSHLEHSVRHSCAIVLKKDKTYLLGKGIKI